MREIPLTQGKVALVDDADYEWLNQWKWFANRPDSQYTFYAARQVRVDKRKQRTEWMHRLILGLQLGDKRQCDHIDGNGLNNQRSNLRICTTTQNHYNRRKRHNASSKYKGVSWHRPSHKWLVHIGMNGKQIHLGYFDSESDAAHAYNEAARKHFGEYALTNRMS